MSKVILHCDMNNFFASVECLLNPDLKDKRIAVCGSKEERHGIVLAKNDAAKKFGVTTAEPIWQAQKKCPDLVIVSPHYKYYSLFSEKAKAIYSRYTDLIEPMGIDECWLDVTGSVRLFGSGEDMANEIRNTVHKELGLTVSVGVSFNKIFAKLGSDMNKPDAVTVIDRKNYKEKIYDLSVGELLGVGRSLKEKLSRIGVDTIGELASAPLETLICRFGKHGEAVWKFANAEDKAEVLPIDYSRPVKSVGRGSTMSEDLKSNDEVKKLIFSLSISVSRQLRKLKLLAGVVQITVRDELLKTHEFQRPLTRKSDNAAFIATESFDLFLKRYKWDHLIRSVTVRVTSLLPETTPFQLSMFYDDHAYIRNCKKERALDDIEKRFGKKSVVPLMLLEHKEQKIK